MLNFCHSASDAIYYWPKQFNNFAGQGPAIDFEVRRIRITPANLSVDQSKFVILKKVKLNYHLHNVVVWQDGIVVSGNDISLPTSNLSFLTLHGMPGENGTYACRLNNSRHETFKYFTVKFDEERKEKSQLSTIIISVVVVLVVVLIAAIGLSIKLYRDKVFYRNQRFVIIWYDYAIYFHFRHHRN